MAKKKRRKRSKRKPVKRKSRKFVNTKTKGGIFVLFEPHATEYAKALPSWVLEVKE